MIRNADQQAFRHQLIGQMENHFGPVRGWPQMTHAALDQIEQLRTYSSGDFEAVVECLQRSLERAADGSWRQIDYFGRCLTNHFGPEGWPDRVQIAWSISYGLHILLGDDYTKLSRALIATREMAAQG